MIDAGAPVVPQWMDGCDLVGISARPGPLPSLATSVALSAETGAAMGVESSVTDSVETYGESPMDIADEGSPSAIASTKGSDEDSIICVATAKASRSGLQPTPR